MQLRIANGKGVACLSEAQACSAFGQRRNGLNIWNQGHFTAVLEETSAGPVPVSRPFHESPTNRIIVDVVDRGMDNCWGDEITIIAAAALPEPVFRRSVWLSVSHPDQEARRLLADEAYRPSCHRLLDVFQHFADRVAFLKGIDQQVDMFRHQNISPYVKPVFVPCLSQRFNEPYSRAIATQERSLLKATECQGMRLSRFIVSLTRLEFTELLFAAYQHWASPPHRQW